MAVRIATASSSFAIVWIFFYQLTLLSGAFGYIVCWYACFLLIYWMVTALTVDRPAAADRVITTIVASCAALIIGLLLYIVIWVVVKGVQHFTLGFLYNDDGLLPTGRPTPLQRRGRWSGDRRVPSSRLPWPRSWRCRWPS